MTSTHSNEYRRLIEELVKARKKSGLTQQALARQIGKPQSFISKIENGERRLDVIELIEITRAIGANYKKIIDAALRK